jgi:hypothetical protein
MFGTVTRSAAKLQLAHDSDGLWKYVLWLRKNNRVSFSTNVIFVLCILTLKIDDKLFGELKVK